MDEHIKVIYRASGQWWFVRDVDVSEVYGNTGIMHKMDIDKGMTIACIDKMVKTAILLKELNKQ